jgi:Methyltransferase domain
MLRMFKSSKKVKNNVLNDLGPLYHNYSFFGVDNEQKPGIYELNQQTKAPVITAYIAYAIAKSKKNTSDNVSFSELFCADGFYAMVSARLGCYKCIGIDNNKNKQFDNAQIIADRLNIKGIEFKKEEITASSKFDSTDIVANVGGLYHVDAPDKIVELSYKMAKKYLIVQSVVSLATDSEDYFEAPAPGWTWGNRYSRQSFDKMIKKICPNIIDHHFNELEGNDRLENRGSVYYLIQK